MEEEEEGEFGPEDDDDEDSSEDDGEEDGESEEEAEGEAPKPAAKAKKSSKSAGKSRAPATEEEEEKAMMAQLQQAASADVEKGRDVKKQLVSLFPCTLSKSPVQPLRLLYRHFATTS